MYNHSNNYTKAVIRPRFVNIGEYSFLKLGACSPTAQQARGEEIIEETFPLVSFPMIFECHPLLSTLLGNQ